MKRAQDQHLFVLCALLATFALAACGALGSSKHSAAIEVRFEGNQQVSSSTLEAVLERFYLDFDAARFKKSAVDDAAYDLERSYLNAGYPNVGVTYTYEERADSKPLSVFKIVEGPHADLARVEFTGNKAFSKRALEAFFEPPTPGLLEESTRNYVESNVKASIDEVTLAYQTRGYLEVAVDLVRVDFEDAGTRATVHVDIREGVLFRVASIDIQGGDPRLEPALLAPVRETYVGRPFYERLSVEIQGRIEEVYAAHGFGDVHVTRMKRASTSDGSVDLAYSVASGPQITVGAIEVSGNEATRAQFVRSRLALHTGKLYAREDERKSFGRLYRSGVFERVSMRLVPGQDEDATAQSVVRPVHVDVVESPAIEMFVEPGYGSYEEFRLAAGARHKNLFGTGRILDFHGVVGRLAQRGELSLIDPWLFESDVVADVSLFGNRRHEPSFLFEETGVGVGLTRRFTPAIEASAAYRFRRSDALDVEVLDADALAALDQVNISEIAGSVAYDTRDNVFQPTEGTFTKIGVEYGSPAFGSDLHFTRVRAQHSSFVSLDTATVLGASLRGGWIQPLGNTDTIPLQERFFNGGENTVRSFRESELGPKDAKGEPLGGEGFSVLSIELRRRLRGRFEGALFWDIGNVVSHHENISRLEGYEQALGIGLRYSLPVGPVRLDLATNPDPGEFESRYVVHLSLGMAF